MRSRDANLLDEMKGEDSSGGETGLILLVELDNLVGITPFAVRETGSLLYLEALAIITEKKGRRHEVPQLAMFKHISALQQTSHMVLTPNKSHQDSYNKIGFQWFHDLGEYQHHKKFDVITNKE